MDFDKLDIRFFSIDERKFKLLVESLDNFTYFIDNLIDIVDDIKCFLF